MLYSQYLVQFLPVLETLSGPIFVLISYEESSSFCFVRKSAKIVS